MRFDEIGYWSELKLEIIRKYARAYSTILTRQARRLPLRHVYIDDTCQARTCDGLLP